jgi:very-short-patch-repair endonuclease
MCPKVIGSTRNRNIYEELSPVAVRMRKEPTSAEQILWQELRAKKLGVKFRRQHLIDQFIVDFYCVELGLVIEVDGGVHRKKQSADLEREQILKALGCSIIRFNNKAVEEELPKVIKKIKDVIRDLSK